MLEGEESSWRETLIVIENRGWTIVTDPTFTDRSYLQRPKFTFVHSPPEHCHEISWTSENPLSASISKMALLSQTSRRMASIRLTERCPKIPLLQKRN